MRWSYTVFAFEFGLAPGARPCLKFRSLLLTFALLLPSGLHAIIILPSRTPQSPIAYSENRKFLVEVTENEAQMKVVLTVFKLEQGIRTFLWRKVLLTAEDDEKESPLLADYRDNFTKWVSNDGTKVIMWLPEYPHPERLFLRAVTKGGRDRHFLLHDIFEPLDLWIERLEYQSWAHPFEVVLTAQDSPCIGFWEATTGRWTVLDLNTLKLGLPTEPQIAALNKQGLIKARNLIRDHQPQQLSNLLTPVKSAIAKALPGTLPPISPGPGKFPEEAYRFLAYQKQPDDRDLLKRLLSFPPAVVQFSQGYNSLVYESPERELADELLAGWDSIRREASKEKWGRRSFKPLAFLSRVTGSVRLPFVAPVESGFVRIYLIPAATAEKAWTSEASLPELTFRLEKASYPLRTTPQVDHVPFVFNTVHPGRYRLKAIWDKRPPHSAGIASGGELVSPGDYESLLSDPFVLQAGDSKHGFILECTNRVGQASEYFAADELWAAEHPAAHYFEPEVEFFHESKPVFAAPASEWITRTNFDNGAIRLKQLAWMEEVHPHRGTNRFLQLKLRIPRPPLIDKSKTDPDEPEDESEILAILKDSHGCEFEVDERSHRQFVFDFWIPPLGETNFTLELFHQTEDESRTRLAAFALRNLWAQAPLARPPPPLSRQPLIAGMELSLRQFSTGEPKAGLNVLDEKNSPPQFSMSELTQFEFTKNGKTVEGLAFLQGIFVDRWGNWNSTLDPYCREEEDFLYQPSFIRVPSVASFEPHETFSLPLEAVPELGQNRSINKPLLLNEAAIQLLWIAGPGTHGFDGPQLVSSLTNLPSGRNRFSIQPVAVSDGSGLRPVVSSTVPFLVCSILRLPGESRFDVLGRHPSIREPRDFAPSRFERNNQKHRGTLRCIPLNLTPGATNQQITLIVQKPITVQFPVKIPKRSRENLAE